MARLLTVVAEAFGLRTGVGKMTHWERERDTFTTVSYWCSECGLYGQIVPEMHESKRKMWQQLGGKKGSRVSSHWIQREPMHG